MQFTWICGLKSPRYHKTTNIKYLKSIKNTLIINCRACFFTVIDKSIKWSEKTARIKAESVTGASRPFRLPDSQDTGRIFPRKISTFGGNPPFLTIWILAFWGMLPHTEEIPHQWGYSYANSHCKSQNRLHYIFKIGSYAGLSCSPCIPTAPHRKQILSHWVADCKGKI